MNENILTCAAIRADEPIPLLAAEPLHDPGRTTLHRTYSSLLLGARINRDNRGADQQRAESERRQDVYQLVSLSRGPDGLADDDEYQSAGAFRLHARGYSKRQSQRAGE